MTHHDNQAPRWVDLPDRVRGENQPPADRLAGVRKALSALSLSEEALSNGIPITKLSALKARINELDLAIGSAEGWLVEWLAKEQARGSVLYAAAMINKTRNGRLDASRSDPRSRTVIISRFNTWVRDLLNNMDEYEASCRQPTVVAPWIANAENYRDRIGTGTAG